VMDRDRLRSGDAEFFEELVKEYGGVVLRVAGSFASGRDDAEDLFQEIWLRVFERRESYSGGSFLAWLFTVARRTCISRYRRDRTRLRTLERMSNEELVAAGSPSKEDALCALIRKQRAEDLSRRLLALTEREQMAIVLRVIEGRTPDEVSEMMDCEKATVRSLIRNGVSRLRKTLEDETDAFVP
jgi:RNA polymerase sigma-70 factor, ECF subfamily